MNNDNGSIDFEARLRLEKLEEGVKEMEKMLNDSMKSSQKETDKLQQSINNLAKGAMAFFTLSQAKAFVSQVIEVRSQFQQLEISFGTMLKSKEKANALMAQLTDLAAKTPFGLEEVSEGAKRLLAFQVPAQEVTETLRRMGDVAAGLGVPMGQLIHVYGQVKAQGKLMTNDLYQFMNAGIPIIAELSKVVGKSETEIKDMVSAGKIGFPEVQAVIKNMTNEGGLFFNLMAEQSKSLGGQISNLGDSFDQMLNEIGKASEGYISGAIQGVSFLVENYQTLGKVIAGLIATYGTYRTAVLVNIALTKGWSIATKEDAIAKGIQTAATKAQTIATAALNTVMKANPYVLVASAVVALGFAMWALKDNTTAAEKAQQDYNNQKQKAIDWEQQHKQKIDDLIESATNQALADTERQKALIALQNEYPNIFAKYDIETLKLADILKLKQEIAKHDSEEKKYHRTNEFLKYQDFEKALNKAKTGKSTYDISKLKNSILDEEMTRVFGKNWFNGSNLSDVEKYIKERQKIAKNDVKGDVIASWTSNLKNLSEDEIKKELEHRQKLIADLQKQKKAGNKWASHGVNFGGDWFAFNEEELQAQSKTLQAQLDKLHEQTYEYKDLTKEYTQAVKDAEIALDKITKGGQGKRTKEEFANAIKEAEENLKNAKKTLEDHKTSLSKSKGTKATKTKTELPTFNYEKDKRDKERLEKDRMFEEDEAKIKAMKDGGEKRNALLVFEYEKRAETIKRKGEDELQAFIETEKQKAEAEGKWKKGQDFNTDTPAIQEEKARIAKNQEVLNQDNLDEYTRQQEAMYKELLEKYQTYTDQRKAIEEKYNADIAALQAKLGADAPQVKKAQDEKARELKKLDILYKKEGTAIAKLFDNLRKKTVKEIRQTITDAEAEIDELAKVLNMDDNANVEFITNLKQQLEQARDTADKSDTVFGRLGKNIQAIFKFKPNTIEWKEALQGVLSDAQSITGEFGQLGQEFEKLGQSTGNEALKRIGQTMQMVSNTLNRTLSMAQTGGSIGGGWGAAIGAVVGLVTSGIEAQSKARMEHEKKLQEIAASKLAQQSEYNRLLWEERMLMKGNTSIFGTKEIASSLEYLKIYNDEWTKLQKNLFDDGNVRSYWDTRTAKDYNFYEEYKKIKGTNDKFETALDKINIVSGSHKEGFLWWSKSVNDYSKLTSMYPELIKSNGEFNRELAESIVKTEQFGEGGKEALQEIINQYDRAQEAQKKFEEYIKNTFGELGKSITDNVYNALQKGEDAFESFAKTVGNVIGKLGKQLVYELYVAGSFKNLQEKIRKAADNNSGSRDFAEQSSRIVGEFGNTMKSKIGEMQQFLRDWNTMSSNIGFNFLDEQRKATEKGFARMSQDTGEELNGRFTLMTALEKQTVDGIKEMHQSLVSLSERQLRHLANIDTNTYQLHQVKDDISGMKKDMAGVKRGIDELTTKGIKLKQ
nr:MAG TPA: tail tape measure protein [Caudoviricetes sp.]